MRGTFLAIFCLLFHLTTAQAESLEDLINTGGTLTGGSVVYSNFSGSVTAPALPPCGGSPPVLPCGFFIPSLATIDVRATGTGLDISGIAISVVTPFVQQPPGVTSTIGIRMSYDVSTPLSVLSMSAEIIPSGGNPVAVGNTVTANQFNGDEIGLASTVMPLPGPPGCQAPPAAFFPVGSGCVQVIGPVPINASRFHVIEDIGAIPAERCQTGPPSQPPGGGSCSFSVSASATATFSTVPEPGTGLLALTGLIGIGLIRRVINKK
jgi:hypothetical protein